MSFTELDRRVELVEFRCEVQQRRRGVRLELQGVRGVVAGSLPRSADIERPRRTEKSEQLRPEGGSFGLPLKVVSSGWPRLKGSCSSMLMSLSGFAIDPELDIILVTLLLDIGLDHVIGDAATTTAEVAPGPQEGGPRRTFLSRRTRIGACMMTCP